MSEQAFTNAQRAEVLTQALPYIRRYVGRTVVILSRDAERGPSAKDLLCLRWCGDVRSTYVNDA